MKVAIFTETYYPFISGVVTHIETVKKGLEARGDQVLIVTMDPHAQRHYVQGGVLYCPAMALKRLYGYGVANPLNLERYRIVQDFNPDIIHIQTEFTMGIFGLFCARRMKKPVVYTLHTSYDDYLFYVAPHKNMQNLVAKPVAHSYFRHLAKYATEVIGPSVKVVSFLRRCGVDRHINVIPNIVDLSIFLPENVAAKDIEAARADLGLQKGDTALLFVGRLGREKSIDVLIQNFAAAHADCPRTKLFIIGDGPEKPRLQAQIHSLGMEGQIRLMGKMDHGTLPPYFHACDLFVTASLSEINSISMLEAMASGLYVLQRLDIYNKDQIREGVNGHLYTTGPEFTALVQEQVALSESAKQARRKTVCDSTRGYGPREFTQAVVDVYNRALDEYAARRKH